MKSLLLWVGSAVAFALLSFQPANGQQPTPRMMVVQAANAPAPSAKAEIAPAKSVGSDNAASLQTAIKALRQAKEANAETLKHQQATLQQLEDLQKAAEQLKIFSKRG